MPPSPTGHDLVLAEGEGGRVAAEVADRAAAVARRRAACAQSSMTMRSCAAGERDERIHVDGPAAQVDGDDGAGAVGEDRADRLGGEVAAVAVDVGDDRRRAHGDHGARGRDEGARGHDDLVARADAERAQRELEREGAVGQGDRVRAADALGVLGLEASGPRRRSSS